MISGCHISRAMRAIYCFVPLLLCGLLQVGDVLSQECVAESYPQDACTLPSLNFITGTTVNENNCNDEFLSFYFVRTPRVTYSDAQPGTNYSFFFIGFPDILHWGVVNIPGSALTSTGDVADFDQLAGYLPPIPPLGAFTYRPVLYRQTSRVNETSIAIPLVSRIGFDLKGYAERNGLCGPIAGTQARVHQPFYL